MSSDNLSVIAAFPATGKSYLAQRYGRYADSDSSQFSWSEPGVRHPLWPSNYLGYIDTQIGAGRTVLCSTHQEVRDALVRARIPFLLIYPAVELRSEYLKRMRSRGSGQRLLDFIGDHWDELIESCHQQEGCEHVVLDQGEYLSDVLEEADRVAA